LGSEFSSSQLVIATCVFLIMALVCFALGVLVGRYDVTSSRPRQNVQSTESAAESAKPLPPAPRREAAPPDGVGEQKSPRPVVMPPTKAQTPGFPSSDGAAPSGPRVTEHPAPPPKPETPPTAAPTPESKLETPGSKPAEQPSPPPPAAAEVPATAPPAAEVKLDPKAVAPAASTLPVEHPTPAQTAPPPAMPSAPAAGTTAQGDYGIQLASFSGPNRQTMAEASKKRLETNTDMKADLLVSEDGKMVRLVVGHYTDKATATKACEELKKRAGFADCFPRKR